MLWDDAKGMIADYGSRIGLMVRSSPLAPVAKPLAAIGGVSAAALATIMLFSTSTAVESALASAMADPAAILAARSPGARAPGALTQTKLAYAHKAPVERALGQERTRPTAATPAGTPVAALPSALPVTQQALGAPVAEATDPLVTSPGLVPTTLAPVSGVTGVGGGGGGNTGGGGGGTTTPVDPPVSAVPEPSTWLMTILGFFTAGLGLRRRRGAPLPRTVEAR
ncbi:PEP-CTERM sorting domain-containing protein [Sphingomonas sp. KR1UV-12]|uniref:PEP-CTERM sorting domain-containing protein n=1 Tax=Sphingomonas aurea TaxID=3063994 RepID=A0ABT9ELK1_9SPHN|nr:PEP-CTERM sorting domain-containing protein [Sphingomonas sp. KR1UV-12]MDP1027834.1 PEP-CTERM sorting domain-containing protein [Sphingomonas sp. KR1UV-12]